MKRIAIIGGGWVGCHLAMAFRNEAEVTLYEKNHTLISETSFINQNRLHYGYHYARNAATRRLCATTFVRFMEDYGDLVHDVGNNYYAVSEDESLLDAETISIIFGNGPHTQLDPQAFSHTSLLLDTPEKRIDAIGANLYFQWCLESLVKKEKIQRCNLQALKQDYDFVLIAPITLSWSHCLPTFLKQWQCSSIAPRSLFLLAHLLTLTANCFPSIHTTTNASR